MDLSEKPDLAAVLEHYGADLSGIPDDSTWRQIHCPFHDDTTPSAGVNLYEGKFRCLRCQGYHGDSITIIREAEGLDFRAALEWARTHLGFTGSSVREAARPEQYKPSWAEDGD